MKISFDTLKIKNHTLYGYYDPDNNEIVINKKLKLRIKMRALWHEYIHYLIVKFKLKNDWHFLNDVFNIIFDKKSSKNQKYKNLKMMTKYYYSKEKFIK